MFHELLRTWFTWVEAGGYVGIFLLMAMESSIIPVPSEIVMAPAAFWAAQGKMDFAGVILAGTFGSYAGSCVGYWVSRWLGEKLIHRYGKFVFISSHHIDMAENWVSKYGLVGVFTARMLPVVRHLISIPAGAFKMPFQMFSLATIAGAGLWCSILTYFGQAIIGHNPELLDSPEAMVSVIQSKLGIFAIIAVVLALLYVAVLHFGKKRG